MIYPSKLLICIAAIVASEHVRRVVAVPPDTMMSFASFNRLLVGEDCHCDGSSVHCTGSTDEALCHCDDGELHCIGEDCHCDGDAVHCTEESDEDLCTCTDGSVLCDASANLVTEDDSKPWGNVIAASMLVNVMTLVGVIVVAGEYLRKLAFPAWHLPSESRKQWTHNYIPMFACGALLATVVFLVLPEAYLLIAESLDDDTEDTTDDHADHDHRFLEDHDHEEHDTETGATWRWGLSILCGFLIPVTVHFFFGEDHKHDEEIEHYKTVDNQRGDVFATSPKTVPAPTDPIAQTKNGHTDDDEENDAKTSTECASAPLSRPSVAEEPKQDQDDTPCNPSINWSLFLSLSVGDFFHNFADGIFIGTSFLLCENTVAMTVVAATVAHELPQEIADFFLLVHQCHMSPIMALVMNFLIGFSVMFGGIIVLAIPHFGNLAIGTILALSGGVYLHVAICECYGRAEKHQTTTVHKLGGLLAFIIGAIPIGLVLLNHEHCGEHDH